MTLKIYTKTGDDGTTGLFGGDRRRKDDIRVEAYGCVDELNAHLGYLIAILDPLSVPKVLHEIQKRLFTIGSNLATEPNRGLDLPDLTPSDIELLEHAIDEMEKELSPLKHFLLPVGHPHVAWCHVCRTVCRRAERRVVSLAAQETVADIIIRYLNRLSDYLFILGRFIARNNEVSEVPWIPRK